MIINASRSSRRINFRPPRNAWTGRAQNGRERCGLLQPADLIRHFFPRWRSRARVYRPAVSRVTVYRVATRFAFTCCFNPSERLTLPRLPGSGGRARNWNLIFPRTQMSGEFPRYVGCDDNARLVGNYARGELAHFAN